MGMIVADSLSSAVHHSPPVITQGNPIVDEAKVDAAETAVRNASNAGEPANLAKILENPDLDLNQAERNALVQRLARDEHLRHVFFGDDNFASKSAAEVSENQRVIAEAVQTAYSDGALNKDDLLAIADANGTGNGAQRFMHVLTQNLEGRLPGGVGEVLADALWERNGNDGVDRAVASIHYASDPSLMYRNLDTPDKRAAAFESLVRFNESAPYKSWPDEEGRLFESSALSAAGQIFTRHSEELVNRYTSLVDGDSSTDWLAKFVSQTVLNPDAQGIALDRHRDLVPMVTQKLTDAAEGFIERAEASGEKDRAISLEQLGRLTASVTAGGAYALNNYSEQLAQTKEGNALFADLMGAMLGDLFSVGGNIVGTTASEIVEKLIEDTGDSKRPDLAAANLIEDTFTDMVAKFRDSQGNEAPHALTNFNSAYSRELSDLQRELNINLGGYPT